MRGNIIRKVDPITFEILRHRLQLAVEEAAQNLKNVSGSPVASEIGDLNVGIFDKNGQNVAVGQYTICKATALSFIIKDILENYQENPGIYEGDAFICNDPYVGVMHQNDVGIVMPYFKNGELIAWTGADVHQTDVGGPTPGQVQLGAKNIYGEAPSMPPMKIMANGVLLKDVERNYIRKSRVPDMVALDLRAKIAACNTMASNLDSIYEQLGSQGLQEFFDDMLNDAEYLLREELKKIPDGRWSARGFLEWEDNVYPVVTACVKKGDHLTIDFTGTDKQAPATVNMTYKANIAWQATTVATTLCWDIPWTIGGIERVFDLKAPLGTLANPEFPAGVSKSTTSFGLLTGSIIQIAMSKMIMCCPGIANKATGAWPGSKAQEELHGWNQYGIEFNADILDGMSGGGGARLYKDGVNTGGMNSAPRISISNVEEYEQQYPLLYIYRRELPDSGGAGVYRGGNGLDRMYVVHDKEKIDDVIMHSIGSKVPATMGLSGGQPASTNLFMLKRGSSIEKMFAVGILPGSYEEVDGTEEIYSGVEESTLSRGDVYRVLSNGGGGYGDPLGRSYELIQADYDDGQVTVPAVKDIYGCIIGQDGKVDVAASDELRRKMYAERLALSVKPKKVNPDVAMIEKKFDLHINLLCGKAADNKTHIFCRCGKNLGFAKENYLDNMAYADQPLKSAGKYVDTYDAAQGQFFIRRWYCPACGRELNNEILARGWEPLPADIIEMD